MAASGPTESGACFDIWAWIHKYSRTPKPEFGAATISLVGDGGPLFQGTPSHQTVWESHNDEVTTTPPGFTVIAESESCRVQAMQNEELDRFGLQFHPEVNDTEFGSNIFENFVEICKSAKSA